MKIIAVNASPRKNQSTHFLLGECIESMKQTARDAGRSVEIERIDLARLSVAGCIACDKCKKGVLCSQQDDFQQIIPKLADEKLAGIVMATPVYMGCMTGQAKAFLDRTVLFRRNGFLFRNKLGGVLTVGGSRNGGQELTIQAVHAAMMIHDMIIVGDGNHFGGAAWGNHPEGFRGDAVGIETARNLGRRMVEVACRLNS